MAQQYSFANPLKFESPAINQYIDARSTMAANTYRTTKARMSMLPHFALEKFDGATVDQIIEDIKAGRLDRYKVLSAFAAYIKSKKKSDDRIRVLVKAARLFLEFHDIEFSDRQFKMRVPLPRPSRSMKTPADKLDIAEVLLACPDIDLKTFIMLVAATGMRPIEACSIRHGDLNFTAKPPRVNIRKEFTKMRVARDVYLTSEVARQLKELMDWKHRVRYIAAFDEKGARKQIKIIPKPRAEDLLFAPYRRDETHDIRPAETSLYVRYATQVAKLLDATGKGEREKPNGRRKMTLYTLRRYAKSTISDLGHSDFSEFFIGHQGSVYYSRKEEERVQVFKKIESYLTFLDVTAMESQGADLQSRMEELQTENLDLRRNMKDMVRKEVAEALATFKKEIIEEGLR